VDNFVVQFGLIRDALAGKTVNVATVVDGLAVDVLIEEIYLAANVPLPEA
jgi:hypothetical protein